MKKSCSILLAFAALGFSASVSQAAILNFTIENKTNSIVEAFHASPVGTTDWEEDLLGDTVLAPGEKRKIMFDDSRGVCNYDILFEFTDDSDLEDLKDTKNLCSLDVYTVHE